jgi:hypothetical protein
MRLDEPDFGNDDALETGPQGRNSVYGEPASREPLRDVGRRGG